MVVVPLFCSAPPLELPGMSPALSVTTGRRFSLPVPVSELEHLLEWELDLLSWRTCTMHVTADGKRGLQ